MPYTRGIYVQSHRRSTLSSFFRRISCPHANVGLLPRRLSPRNVAELCAGARQPSSPAQAQQKLPTVTTTVIVHGEAKDDYLPETVTVGTLDGATLQQAPLSATVVTRDLLTDQVARVLSDVVKNDASIGEDYAPVGYYGDFEIRGFPSIWPPALKSTE